MSRHSKRNDWPPERIKRLRAKLGLRQTALADILRVHFTAPAKWENGTHQPGGTVQLVLDSLEIEFENRKKAEPEAAEAV